MSQESVPFDCLRIIWGLGEDRLEDSASKDISGLDTDKMCMYYVFDTH